MPNFPFAMDRCERRRPALTSKRRLSGTTLIEILVVIVIFLIGILAVVQVFPGGFRLLVISRNASMASQLGRDEIERLKARPDLIPEQILAVRYQAGIPIADVDPTGLGPTGDSIDAFGKLTRAGSAVSDDWLLASGPNVARRIVGEGQRVPVPRPTLGGEYGGVMVLDHGPVDRTAPVVAYANDLSRTVGVPRDSAFGAPFTSGVEAMSPDGSDPLGAVGAVRVITPAAFTPYQFFVVDAQTPEAAILLPPSSFDRTYRVRFSGQVNGTGGFRRVDFVSLSVKVTALSEFPTPLVRVRLADLVLASGALASGDSLIGVELDTVRVAPQYAKRTATGWAGGDPFEMKVLDLDLGVLVFAPAARETTVARPGGVSEPLLARVDYDVLDWRILHEDFRITGSGNSGVVSFNLALQGIKVGLQAGPDGRLNGPLSVVGSLAADADLPTTDNLVVVDLTSGRPLVEDVPLVRVDKGRGIVTLADSDPRDSGLQVKLVGIGDVGAENRTMRVYYRARNEWSVQLMKGASQYSILQSGTPGQGQCLVGGTMGVATRLYFPRSEANRKVTIDTISYERSDGTIGTIEGQDFLIQYPRVGDGTSLPCVDLATLVPDALGFSRAAGEPVQGVKSASLAVRVLWNPDQFTLGSNGATNLASVDRWGRGWRKTTTETFLRAEETR